MRALRPTTFVVAIVAMAFPVFGPSPARAESSSVPSAARGLVPPTDDLRPWPTFAGYGERTVDRPVPAMITATIPVIDPGDCSVDVGVVGLIGEVNRGTGQLAAGEVISICSAGVSYTYVRLVNANGQQFDIPDTTAAGDQIVVTLTTGKTAMTIEAEDLTQGWKHALNGPLFDVPELDVGESTAQAGGFALALPDIRRARITSVKFGKKSLGEADHFRWTCVGEDGTLRMRPTKIVNGTDFAVSFKAP